MFSSSSADLHLVVEALVPPGHEDRRQVILDELQTLASSIGALPSRERIAALASQV